MSIWRQFDPDYIDERIDEILDARAFKEDNMQKTVTIELKVRFKDAEKFDIVRKAAARSAQGLLAAACLISDEHKPIIAVSAFDPFDGNEGIDIFSEVTDEE